MILMIMKVGPGSDDYRLTCTGFEEDLSTLGDAMQRGDNLNGWKFTTK